MMKCRWIRQLFTRRVTGTIRKAPHRVRLVLEALEDRCVPSTIVVNNPTDTGAAGQTDLRQAIAQANATGGDETITFDPSVFATAQTITLTGGQLELSDTSGTETITAPAAGVTITGNNASRVFQIDGDVTASISGVTITGGTANKYRVSGSSFAGGGVLNNGTATLTDCTVSGNSCLAGGGGVSNYGTATLTNCTVSGNSCLAGGGGVANYGTATLTNCIVSGNTTGSSSFAIGEGGGVFNSGTATLTNCTVSGNSADLQGGGVWNEGTATLTNCTVSGNKAPYVGVYGIGSGGGVWNDGTATLTNCTVSGNKARYAAGVYNLFNTATLTNCTVSGNSATRDGGGVMSWYPGATATLTNCTISGNSANNGGGVFTSYDGTATLINCTVSGNSASQGGGVSDSGGGVSDYGGTINIGNTIVAGNTASGSGPDVSGTVVSLGNNLIGGNPLLAPLGYYGGPTETMALLPGSPALDAGNNSLIPAGVTTDQRGLPRIVNGTVDIGAFQTQAGPLVVNTTDDTSTAEPAGELSLRDAINLANALGGSRTITFDPSVFATAQTITLAGTQLELSDTSGTEKITAPAAGVTISGNNASRVFQIDRGVTASISGVTITGGSSVAGGGVLNNGTATLTDCTISGNSGGGVATSGTATLTNCTVSGNSARYGGGVATSGTATLTNCTVSGNTASGAGGGVFNLNGTATLTNCTVSGNSANYGGGVWNESGTATLTNCTVSGNSARHSGGVANYGTATLTNCTVSGNSADQGGGVANFGTATLTNCTVSGNSANNGGGVFNWYYATATLTNCTVSGNSANNGGGLANWVGTGYYPAGTIDIGNTIVAGNTASSSGPDVYGPVVSLGNNLIGATDGSTSSWLGSDRTGAGANPLDPLLAPLGNYGGPTQTMALLPGSPALDAGSNALIPIDPATGQPYATDQRGEPRIVNGAVDIGAFEVDTTTVATSSAANNTTVYGQDATFTATVTAAVSGTLGGTVQFYVNGAAVGSAVTLSGGQATYDAGTTLNAATYQVTAVYSGAYIAAGSFDSSGSPALSYSVTPAASTTTVVDAGGTDDGSPFPETGVLATGAGGLHDTNPADFTFSYAGAGATVYGPSPDAPVGPGAYTVTATYHGDANHTGSTSAPIPFDIDEAPSLVVTTANDVVNPTDGVTSLREAIAYANALGGSRTITFDPTVFATARTITLIGTQLELSDTSGTETITAPAAGVTISGNNASRVFQIDRGVTASISGVTITGGSSVAGGGVLNNGTATLTNCTVSGNSANYGGGVWNESGTATLTNCTVSGNSSAFFGGGVWNDGTATLTNCTVSGNTASVAGGGVFNLNGTATLTNCTVSGNKASQGGGVWNESGTATLTNCTVSGNSARHSGGVANYGTATLTNCTVSGNKASQGGGVFNDGTATLTNCTVSGNSASQGGGVFNWYYSTATLTNCTVSGNSAQYGGGLANWVGTGYYPAGTIDIGNTIVAGNTASSSGPDVSGTVVSQGHNLIGATDGSSSNWLGSDRAGAGANPLDPLLAPLGNYGGPTETMALLPGSPALDAGSNALIPIDPATGQPYATDQRGEPRIVNGAVDIGAFEVDTTTVVTSSAANNTSVYGHDATVTATVTAAVAGTLGGTVQFYVNGAAAGSAVTLSGGQATYDAGTTLNAATDQVTAVYSGAYIAAGSFDSSGSAALSYSVTPAPLTITADSQTKVYGAALPTLTASYSGFVNGDTTASLTTLPTLSTTATAASHVSGGPYAITASGAADPDYTIGYAAGALTVTPAALTISADNQTKVYGAALPTLTASYSGFVNGDTTASLTTLPTLSTTATAASHVSGGPYAITASGAADPDYTIGYAAGALTVTPAALTISADNQTKVYGAALPTLTASYSGFVNGDTTASLTTLPTLSTTATAASHVSGSPYAITASGAVDADYTISYVAGTLTVDPVALTISADNQTKVYGAALPTLTASYSGFVNGDTTASLTTLPTLSTTATAASHVSGGPYAITASGAADPDYTIGYAAGALTVTPAALTISADNQTKVYGAALPTLTASYSGFVNGDTTASLTTLPTLSTTATAASHVSGGPYAITASGAVDPDYTISYVAGTLTVDPVALTITAANGIWYFGLPKPPFGVTYAGFVNGDTSASLTTPPTVTTTATAASPVGTYPITASGAVDADYIIGYVPGTLTVTLPSAAAYILNTTTSGAVTASGNATVNLPGGLYVDSSSASAVNATGNAQVNVGGAVLVVGGVSTSGNAAAVKTGTPGAATDPLASLPLPGVTGLTNYGAVSVSGNNSRTLSPGIYTSIQVSGNASVTLSNAGSGIYIIEGGGLSVSGNASLSGSGVLIFNAGSGYNGTTDGGAFGSISLGGNGTINLSGPTSGPYAGVAIFQARDNSKALSLGGNGAAGITSTIYAPAANMGLSGNATVKGSLVVATLTVTGNAGAFQLSGGANSDYAASTSNWISNGILTVAAEDDTGNGLDPNEIADLSAAMNYLNSALGSFGVDLSWAAPGAAADVTVHFASTTPEGDASDGVLGYTTASNDVYIVTVGWNYYTGSDPSAVGAGQYDFLTLATHELAHTVGLGESVDPSSVMYEYLAPGTVRRTFTDSNLSLIDTNADRFMKAAASSDPLTGGTLGLAPGALPAVLMDPAGSFGGESALSGSSVSQQDGHVAPTPGRDGDDGVPAGGAGNDLMTGGFGLEHVAEDGAEHGALDQLFASGELDLLLQPAWPVLASR